MKINHPVTDEERFLKPGEPVVTKTDLKGAITYANPSFVEISGFSLDELIGRSHNVVRHPDMPPEAFADLWTTIKRGRPWHALVKNRCKDGAYYWVEAFVTPLKENGKTVGYMSVRNAPTRADVEAAATLYADIQAKRASMPVSAKAPGLSQTAMTWCMAAALACWFILLGLAQQLGAPPRVLLAMALVGAAASLGGGGWLASRTLLPLRSVIGALDKISEGNFNFSLDISRRDEFGRLMERVEAMRINLRAIIADVLLAAKRVSAEGERLGGEIHAMQESMLMQAERMQAITSALEQVSVSVGEISDHTRTSAIAAEQAQGAVRSGESNVRESIASAERLSSVMSESRQAMLELNDATHKVGEIAGAIKDIAEQTNLLALNAAIEAARAGEQGRGFAVVADEVRKLAERTAASTSDIANTVGNIRIINDVAVESMNSAVEEVQHSSTRIAETGSSFGLIVDSTQTTVSLASQVSDMLSQQNAATTEVAQNMFRISSIAERNSAIVKEVQSIMQSMNQTAFALRQLVMQFEKSL
ncbi:PAS domain-containing methyl-accepting chemotaxis protein [Chitinivorax sp. PXF-14]|uniref:methyl-accepting chemotaxis protein n=1 Tax=Chitinivorax sp. PXF-14 TaxID=3230488 RepID=UPI003464EF09